MALEGEKIIINDHIVMSLLVDNDEIMYSYKINDKFLERPFLIDRDVDEDTLEKIYNWLIGNCE